MRKRRCDLIAKEITIHLRPIRSNCLLQVSLLQDYLMIQEIGYFKINLKVARIYIYFVSFNAIIKWHIVSVSEQCVSFKCYTNLLFMSCHFIQMTVINHIWKTIFNPYNFVFLYKHLCFFQL